MWLEQSKGVREKGKEDRKFSSTCGTHIDICVCIYACVYMRVYMYMYVNLLTDRVFMNRV